MRTRNRGLDLGNVKDRVDMHARGQRQFDGDRVYHTLHREGANKTGGKLLGGTGDREVLGPEIDQLSREVHRGRCATAISSLGRSVTGAEEGSPGPFPDSAAALDVVVWGRNSSLHLLRREQGRLIAQGGLEGRETGG